jgi:hypothetical protein
MSEAHDVWEGLDSQGVQEAFQEAFPSGEEQWMTLILTNPLHSIVGCLHAARRHFKQKKEIGIVLNVKDVFLPPLSILRVLAQDASSRLGWVDDDFVNANGYVTCPENFLFLDSLQCRVRKPPALQPHHKGAFMAYACNNMHWVAFFVFVKAPSHAVVFIFDPMQLLTTCPPEVKSFLFGPAGVFGSNFTISEEIVLLYSKQRLRNTCGIFVCSLFQSLPMDSSKWVSFLSQPVRLDVENNLGTRNPRLELLRCFITRKKNS